MRRAACVLMLLVAAPARSQAPAEAKPDATPAPAKWTILFCSDDPAIWDTDAKNAKGEQIAIRLKFAPANTRYLRLRRGDTGESLILPLTRDQLHNARPAGPEEEFWWNGTSKEEWKGRHLGIVQNPRFRFPVPKDMIAVMTEGWDAFAGSGFGHKAFVNDAQYYCWCGKEIPKTVFEIGVSPGPLSRGEMTRLVSAALVNIQPDAKAAPTKTPSGTSAPNPIVTPGLSRDNFNLIENGMNEEEVAAILGPHKGSKTSTITQNGSTSTRRTLTWRQATPNMTITVTFTNDRVSGKNCIQIGPAQQ